jgi:hypothetical protein
MDGLISFFGSSHAIRAETALTRTGFAARLVPGPKELSPNCGVALRFDYDQRDRILAVLASKNIRIEAVHVYQPRTDDWSARNGRTLVDKIRRWM